MTDVADRYLPFSASPRILRLCLVDPGLQLPFDRTDRRTLDTKRNPPPSPLPPCVAHPTAFKVLRRDEFARPVLDCLRPLTDMGPEARPSRAEIDAVINRPGATRLWNRATWQLIVGLIHQVGSNIDATGVILRIDAINRRAELVAGRSA